MTKSVYVLVVILAMAVAVAGVFMLLPGDNGNGSDSNNGSGDSDDSGQGPESDIVPSRPDDSEHTVGKLKVRNILEVGDWVTYTIPCKGNPFVIKLTVKSIDSDVANLSAEYDASHKYASGLDYLAEFKKVWARLDIADSEMAGLYPVVDDGTHSSVPLYCKNWSEEMKDAFLNSDGKYVEAGDNELFAEIKLMSHLTPHGERLCIVYDASGNATESEFLQSEGSEDFTYQDFADNAVIDYDCGILWKFNAFGPIEIDSSIFTYE